MSFYADRRDNRLREVLSKGLLMGLAGGLAEVVFIWAYMVGSGREPAAIARAVAAAVHLAPLAPLGIAVHMALSLALGIGLAAVWVDMRSPRPKALQAYLFMTAALIVVWSFNFLVLLPSLSPAFLALLPYPVTFASKLLFGLAGSPVLQRCGSKRLAFAHSAVAEKTQIDF